jgi:ABC-type glycerol-3-phosphate transport system substrate-binding protein
MRLVRLSTHCAQLQVSSHAARSDLATTDGWVIWQGSPHIAEAWELMQWLESDDWWNINLPITAQQPSRKSLQSKLVDVLKKNNPSFQSKHLEASTPPMQDGYARVVEVFKYGDEARTVLNAAHSKAVTLNEAAVADTFMAAAAQINQIEQLLNLVDLGGTLSTSATKALAPAACPCASA